MALVISTAFQQQFDNTNHISLRFRVSSRDTFKTIPIKTVTYAQPKNGTLIVQMSNEDVDICYLIVFIEKIQQLATQRDGQADLPVSVYTYNHLPWSKASSFSERLLPGIAITNWCCTKQQQSQNNIEQFRKAVDTLSKIF